MNTKLLLTLVLSTFILISCGNGNDDRPAGEPDTDDGLTEFQLEHGIGPVTESIAFDEFDQSLADRGADIFQTKCEACHMIDGRMVGPALGDVLNRRTPTYVMNFILNPSGMTSEHPEGQRLLREYMTPMPFQNVSREEARAIVEYLRTYANE